MQGEVETRHKRRGWEEYARVHVHLRRKVRMPGVSQVRPGCWSLSYRAICCHQLLRDEVGQVWRELWTGVLVERLIGLERDWGYCWSQAYTQRLASNDFKLSYWVCCEGSSKQEKHACSYFYFILVCVSKVCMISQGYSELSYVTEESQGWILELSSLQPNSTCPSSYDWVMYLPKERWCLRTCR